MSFLRLSLSAAAMSSATVLRMMAQIFVVPILARFLSPADYGVVAMAMPFVLLAMMFADAGLGMSLVRESQEKTTIWSTCFWLSLLLGFALTLAVAAIAPGVAFLMAEPLLGPIIAVLALTIFLQAAAAVPGTVLQKEKRFGTLAGIEIASMAAGVCCAIAAAVHGWGAWALVAQQMAHYVVKLALTVPLSRFCPRFVLALQEVKSHLKFGRDVLGVQFVNFLAQSPDSLVIGRVLGAAPTGIYSMSMLFANLPHRLVSGPLQFVTYPHFSEIREDTKGVADALLFWTRVLGIIIIPGMAMIVVAEEPLFRILLSEKWASAGTIFRLVAPGATLVTLTGLCGTALLAVGRTDIRMRQAVESGALRVIALLSSVWFGVEWVAIAFSLYLFLYLPRFLYLILPVLGCPVFSYLRTMLVPLLTAVVCAAIYLEIAYATRIGDWGLAALAGGLALSGIAMAALLQIRPLREGIKAL